MVKTALKYHLSNWLKSIVCWQGCVEIVTPLLLRIYGAMDSKFGNISQKCINLQLSILQWLLPKVYTDKNKMTYMRLFITALFNTRRLEKTHLSLWFSWGNCDISIMMKFCAVVRSSSNIRKELSYTVLEWSSGFIEL